jgi:hypothetical protein
VYALPRTVRCVLQVQLSLLDAIHCRSKRLTLAIAFSVRATQRNMDCRPGTLRIAWLRMDDVAAGA